MIHVPKVAPESGTKARLALLRATVLSLTFVLPSLLSGCGGSGGPPSTRSRSPGAMLERVSPLRPGDAVRVALSREPDRSGVYEVDETGTVALPFLGTRKVTDVAPESLRRELLDAYRAQLRNQSIEVRLMRRVRVLGAVQKPGLYHVDRTMTLADLVAQAGGTTNQGSLDNIRLIREGQTIRSDVKRGTGAFQELRSGDQVYVPKRSWFARNSATVVSGTISVLGFLIGVAAF